MEEDRGKHKRTSICNRCSPVSSQVHSGLQGIGKIQIITQMTRITRKKTDKVYYILNYY